MDSRDGSVYLVCEKLKGGVLESFVGLGKQFGDDEGGKRRVMSSFALVGMELCEALMGLHCQGIVSSCLSLSCFGFDAFGHAFVDIGAILMLGRRVRTCVVGVDGTGIGELLKKKGFVSPELLLKLLFEKNGNAPECDSSNYAIGCFSDVWALGCILIVLLMQNLFAEEQLESLYCFVPEKGEEKCDECLAFYKHWGETTSSMLETFLGEEFSSLHQVLCRCLDLDPVGRPCVAEVWRCIRELILEPEFDVLANFDAMTLGKNNVQCLTIGNLCALEEVNLESRGRNGQEIGGSTSISDLDQVTEREEDLVKGVCRGEQKPISLKVHMDCISGFAIGGGFLFSSSFDKTICMWSLQDFSCVQSFRGHEHRITGIVFVESNIQLCISGDVGGGIFVWRVDSDLTNEPLKKWHEDKDWRYSGIHALAVLNFFILVVGIGPLKHGRCRITVLSAP
ncbi:hypothetical protein Syun_003268 [Stephania yunnanensis]|uniref:Protein kinase domain-containing protein n=1 Tax=Stephania yunnanensis TaxID=152371 RepID=A0AAP0L116_9MAGN